MGQNAIYYKGKSYSGGGGGSGTEVIPNPQGEPTDTLNTVNIDGTIYDIASGGGSDISVDPEYDTGTLLATISVDDVDHEIYAPEFESGALYGYIDPTTLLGSDKDIYIKYIGDNVISEWKTAGTFNNPTQHAAYDLEDSFGRDISNDYSISMTYTAGSQSITWEILVANITTSWTKMEGDWNTGYSGIRINPSTNRYEFHTDYMSTHTLKYKTNNFTPISIDSIWHKTDETWHKDNSSKVIANPEDAATDTLTKLSVDGDVYEIPEINVEDVYVNGTSALDENNIAQIKSYQEITKAEYDALPSSKLTDDILYCITDGGATKPGEYFNPVIYSLTEREIGVWIDGKPLYQRTMTIPIVNVQDFTLADDTVSYDKLICSNGIVYVNITNPTWISHNSDRQNSPRIAILPDHKLYYYADDLPTEYNWMYQFTFQYTKTTDTPGSGKYTTLGVPSVHYSTDEQVIGTWIDGKPLYQKTLEISSITKDTWNSYLVDVNAIIREVSGWYADANNKLPLGYFNGSVIMNRVSDHMDGYVSLYGSGTIDKAVVTIKYTKTTD